jgi:hypothetical protein
VRGWPCSRCGMGSPRDAAARRRSTERSIDPASCHS